MLVKLASQVNHYEIGPWTTYLNELLGFNAKSFWLLGNLGL